MTNEPVEVWERRISEILDRKLKPVQHELQQLKRSLLVTQIELASFIVISTTESIIYRHNATLQQHPNVKQRIYTEAGTALTDIKSSVKPLSVAIRFQNKCNNELTKLDVKIIVLS
ncbi:MAG TPA: hypothetical protein VMW86_05040 [Dehalococcoidales bacterium]|nr:hypothetical protein [Dehalococcoidales bacterium]